MQQDGLMKKAAVYCTVFVLTAMGVMLYFSANKTVAIAEVPQAEVVERKEEETEPVIKEENHITIERNNKNTNYFCIPMPDGVAAENVTLENHYIDRELWVGIQLPGAEAQGRFYEENSVFGSCENVLDGHFETEADHIYLKFTLTNVYEYQSIFENSILYVKFVSPKEVYDKIVVIDAAYGAEDFGVSAEAVKGKEITLNIAKALKGKLDDTDIQVYYTRMDDSNPTSDIRVGLAADTKADMLIRIEVGESENTKEYGTEAVYNSRFFIPGFGSVELADILEREVVTAISGKANGLVDAGDDDAVIMDATVPATAIRVGYLTNGQEEILLQREDYIDRIAEGIYNAIMKAYEQTGSAD